jgi:hypothetical protein
MKAGQAGVTMPRVRNHKKAKPFAPYAQGCRAPNSDTVPSLKKSPKKMLDNFFEEWYTIKKF